MKLVTIHEYDKLVTSVYDDREFDDSIEGTLGLELVDVDEVYLTLSYDEKQITMYVSLGQLEHLLKKAKNVDSRYILFHSSEQTIRGEENE